jgi:hypothetical protein
MPSIAWTTPGEWKRRMLAPLGTLALDHEHEAGDQEQRKDHLAEAGLVEPPVELEAEP